jgi:multicomponent K+:H+ antiporter subunit A
VQATLPAFKLAIWHGFNLPLVMSIIALGGGLFYYWRRDRVFTLHERYALEISSPVAFERFYGRLAGFSAQYSGLFLLACLVLGTFAWMGAGERSLVGPLPLTPADPLAFLAFGALVVGVAGATLLHRQRLIAVVLLSLAGVVIALAFIKFAAPDLALTQLSVELASIMLFLLALRFLPDPPATESDGSGSLWRMLVPAGVGVAGALLTFALLTRPFETISAFHVAEAKPGGGGTNVVNVILVDFRGFDTLGEIAVLAMAALGAQALLAGLALRPSVGNAANDADRYPIMLRMMMQPMLPLAMAVAVYIFLRGHNLPGGGFIAGLIAAIALLLQFLSAGVAHAQSRLRIDFARVLGVGLVLAVLTGLASMAFGLPFLSSAFTYIDPPILEEFELASALIFDLGIFLVVVASVVLIITELGQLSSREIRPEARDPVATRPARVEAEG